MTAVPTAGDTASAQVERAQLRILVPNFLRRLFENDLIPEEVDVRQSVIWLAALFAAPAAVLAGILLSKYQTILYVVERIPERYPELVHATWGDELFFILYSMTAVGFVTVLVWESVFPDERDALVLGGLPVRGRTVLTAKVTALVLFIAAFALAISVPTALGFAIAVMGISPLAGPTYLFTHLLVVPLAGLFVFACLIAIQTILAALLHQRLLRAVSVTVQLLLVVTLIEMLIYSPAISAWLRDYATTLATTGESSWLPPLWFLGLYETLLGTDMASFHRLATRALAVTGGVLALAVAAYAFGYRRIFRRAVEGAGPLHQGAGRLARLGPRIWTSLSSNATQQAVIAFVTRGLARSRRHRLVLAIYLGVALAFILGGVIRPLSDGLAITTDAPTVMLLSIPLILSFFTLVGLRVLFAIPTEVRANWVFKMTERNEKQAYLQASRKTMVLLGLGPLALITFPMYWSLWGPELAAQHTLIWLLLGALLTEALLVRFDKVPLACEYLPGKANVKLLWPVYLAVMMSYGYTTARIELALLGNPRRWGIAVGLLSLGLLAALASRRRWLAPAPRLTYEEAPEHTVQQLHLMRPV